VRIKLIEPKFRGEWAEQDVEDIRSFWFPRLTLPTVAALTPPEVDVVVTDENVEEIDYEEPVDLVGLTAMTMHAPAAYAIARRFRQRGIPVVMGGIHASLLPQEALQHVDSVVVGEAEEIWPTVVEDARKGCLRRVYRAGSHPDLRGLPRPRLDLLRMEAYDRVACVQTARGCPFQCDYCSVSRFFGRTFRTRPVEEVVQEVKALGERFVVFVDDNIVGNPSYAKELFRRLIPLGIRWGSQASLSIARDRELLDLAVKSGCYSLFVGIESLSEQNLRDVHKRTNRVQDYERDLKTLRDHGVTVIASFIFGLEHDDEGTFERTVRFCEQNRIPLPVFFILTPIPGTPLYERLDREGRILTKQWHKYDGMHVVFQPRMMSPETLQKGFQWVCQEVYSWGSIARRLFFPPGRRLLPHIGLNKTFRRIARRIPPGEVSPLAKVLQSLEGVIPIREVRSLLPTVTDEALQRGSSWIRETWNVLRIRAAYHEPMRTIFFQLEGAMDRTSTRALIKRVMRAVRTGRSIVIDFERVHHLSPAAVDLLIREARERLQEWSQRIRLVNLPERLNGMWGHLKDVLGEQGASLGGVGLPEGGRST